MNKEAWVEVATDILLFRERPRLENRRLFDPCPNDTDGDGDCGRPNCIHCRGREARPVARLSSVIQFTDEVGPPPSIPFEPAIDEPRPCGNPDCLICSPWRGRRHPPNPPGMSTHYLEVMARTGILSTQDLRSRLWDIYE